MNKQICVRTHHLKSDHMPENKSVFARNLKKVRELMGLTQEDAAARIGIKRPAYAAYEEGRAFPSGETLSAIAEAFSLENSLYEFLNNSEFFDEKGRKRNVRRLSTLEKKYHSLKPPIRIAVDALLNVSQNL